MIQRMYSYPSWGRQKVVLVSALWIHADKFRDDHEHAKSATGGEKWFPNSKFVEGIEGGSYDVVCLACLATACWGSPASSVACHVAGKECLKGGLDGLRSRLSLQIPFVNFPDLYFTGV